MKQKNVLKIFMITLLFMLPLSLMAQTVKGKVTDSDGGSLPYMNVVEKGTTNGTTTDYNGEFSITVKKMPTVLVISSLGYKTVEQKITNTSFYMYLILGNMQSIPSYLLNKVKN
jgi:iron complex outermembrane receptor protein